MLGPAGSVIADDPASNVRLNNAGGGPNVTLGAATLGGADVGGVGSWLAQTRPAVPRTSNHANFFIIDLPMKPCEKRS